MTYCIYAIKSPHERTEIAQIIIHDKGEALGESREPRSENPAGVLTSISKSRSPDFSAAPGMRSAVRWSCAITQPALAAFCPSQLISTPPNKYEIETTCHTALKSILLWISVDYKAVAYYD